MASILRQIVAGPRARHPEAGLDLCYVTDFIVATSGPSSTYPKKAYRNPTDQLVKFLDYKHDTEWAIWEFRAEGTGYPDSEVYGRIHHFPWPDHHPPPFAVIPRLMASMRKWLRYEDEEGEGSGKKHKKKRVAVVHCKAGKGRSGTVACSYLISQEGWEKEAALQRFTDRRMRVGFGAGVSIPSQLRYVGYVDRWTNQLGKKYVERPVEIVEVHVFGLRDGVKVAVEGYIEEGRRMKCFHIFSRQEKTVVADSRSGSSKDRLSRTSSKKSLRGNLSNTVLSSPQVQSPAASTPSLNESPAQPASSSQNSDSVAPPGTQNVLLRPSKPLILPTSDINIDFERRNAAAGYTGLTLVTSVAHVWFNPYFEGGSDGFDSGVFEIQWDAMDGIKGSVRKGVKALECVKVLWRYAKSETEAGEAGEDRLGKVITEPGKGEPVPEGKPTDWRGLGNSQEDPTVASLGDEPSGHNAGLLKAGTTAAAGADALYKQLGLRKINPESIDVSRASSIREAEQHGSSPEEGDNHQPPYPDLDSQAPGEESSKASDLESTTSPTPAGFGRGPKSTAVEAAYHSAVREEQGARSEAPGGSKAAKDSPREQEERILDTGRERVHEPVLVKNEDGGHDVVTYEDGESDEEAVAPTSTEGQGEGDSSSVGNVGLGKLTSIVDKFKTGRNAS